MNSGVFYRWRDDCLILQVYVQPRASRDEIAGVYGDSLKLRITAPPVDGKANAHVKKFLARLFKVPASHIELAAGANSRNKQFIIPHPRSLPQFAAVHRQKGMNMV